MSQREPLIKQPARLSGWLFCFCWMIFFLPNQLNAAAEDDKRLQEVRSEIDRKRSNLSQQKQAIAKLNQALKQDELKVATAAKQLRSSKQDLTETQAEQRKLQQQQQTLEAQRRKQQQVLADQLRSAYLAGQHDYIKLLLNQQQPGRLERTLNYYQYLNRARVDSIEQLLTTVEQLQQLATELERLATEQSQLIQRQQQQQQALTASKRKREKSRRELLKLLDSEEARLAQLQQSENQLLELIANRKAPEVALAGLTKQRGKIDWPLKGRVRHRFGAPRQGGIRWKGLYIEGSAGSDIHAVHQGKVLYADWVKSMGLVLILDHGEGYMSLYAHAQALLKEVGDTVNQGETLALVGQSGGQSRTGLYFELRHKGEPINPSKWFRR